LTITSIAGLSASLSDLQNQINTNDTDISSINTTLDNHNTRINSNDTDIDNINATLNNHNNRILSNDTDIDNINTTLSDHDTRITTNKNSIDTINNTTIPTLRNTIEDTLNDHDTRILENLNSILNINALLASDDTALDELQEIVNFIKLNRADLDSLTVESIAGLVDRLTNLQSQIDGNDTDIDNINTTLSDHDTRIGNNDTDIDNINDTLSDHNTRISSNDTDISSINTTLNNHNARINSNDVDISSINTTLSDHDTRILENLNSINVINNSTIPDLQNDITNTLNDHNTRILENLNSILNINALLASDDTALDELQEIVNFIKLNRADLDSLTITSIAGLSASLSDLQNQINTNDTDISTINTKLVTTSTLNTLQKITDYITTTRAYANNANSKIDGLLGSKSLLHATDPLRVSGNYIYLYRADGTYDRIYVNMSAITTVSSSFGVKGYMRLSNNFIIQWGTDIPGEDVWWNYNFPLTFPHAARSIVASGKEGYTSTNTEVQASIIDQARYRLRANTYHNRYVHWIAIGY
jgi:chromosome segregation ATPase